MAAVEPAFPTYSDQRRRNGRTPAKQEAMYDTPNFADFFHRVRYEMTGW
jgi:hypothetical protein